MSRLKVQHGVSRTRRTKFQASIDQTIADDIELMAAWSNNETTYIVNELLRFAIAQKDFLKYKASRLAHPAQNASAMKQMPTSADAASVPAATTDTQPHAKTARA